MKSSKTSFLRNCISGWNVRIIYNASLCGGVVDFFITFVKVSVAKAQERIGH